MVTPHGTTAVVRALIDQGSELSFVSEAVVQALQLQRSSSLVSLFGIGSQRCGSTRGSVSLTFQHYQDPLVEFCIKAHIIPKLTGRVPSAPVSTDSCSHLSDLQLADPSYALPAPVDVLLGANIYGYLLCDEIRRGDLNSPVAQRTALGWIVSGLIAGSAVREGSATGEDRSVARSFSCSTDQELFELVNRFWAQEAVPSPDQPVMSEEDSRCESHFVESHSRTSGGRFVVRLPFKTKPPSFGDSKTIATRLLSNLHRRFKRDSVLHRPYSEFLAEYLELGHIWYPLLTIPLQSAATIYRITECSENPALLRNSELCLTAHSGRRLGYPSMTIFSLVQKSRTTWWTCCFDGGVTPTW